MKAHLPINEIARLEALRQFNILDTAREKAFDDLALLASEVCGTPIAGISLIDSDRQWFKSIKGLNLSETPRDISFCTHTILGVDVLLIGDAERDERFSRNPLVTGEPSIRSYAGAPLLTSEGYALGAMCVIDRVPRTLQRSQIESLQALARLTVILLETRRNGEHLAAVNDRLSTEITVLESRARGNKHSQPTDG